MGEQAGRDPDMTIAGSRDVGIALGVPEPFAAELQAWRERLGDPDARLIAPHITLLAPVRLPSAGLGPVDAHLRAVAARHAPWTIRLAGSGTFRPVTSVAFVVVISGGVECGRLAEDVRTGVLARPANFPYHPHVTVAHNVTDEQLTEAESAIADYDATFRVWGLTLYGRGADGQWRPQRDYPFGAAEVGPSPPG